MNRKVSGAFTLVEMLVVIAVIAILIALLYPVLGIVEEKANRAKCQSNLHQIGVAAAQQFGELGEKLPYRGTADGDQFEYGVAAEQLMPYVKNVKEVFDCPANPGNQNLENFKFPSQQYWTDYEFNSYLCSYGPSAPYNDKRQNRIVDASVVAYAYDHPYDPTNSPHIGGFNIAYLDGHAAWLRNSDMTQTNRDGRTQYEFCLKGHTY